MPKGKGTYGKKVDSLAGVLGINYAPVNSYDKRTSSTPL